jgi:hypothetical protein
MDDPHSRSEGGGDHQEEERCGEEEEDGVAGVLQQELGCSRSDPRRRGSSPSGPFELQTAKTCPREHDLQQHDEDDHSCYSSTWSWNGDGEESVVIATRAFSDHNQDEILRGAWKGVQESSKKEDNNHHQEHDHHFFSQFGGMISSSSGFRPQAFPSPKPPLLAPAFTAAVTSRSSSTFEGDPPGIGFSPTTDGDGDNEKQNTTSSTRRRKRNKKRKRSMTTDDKVSANQQTAQQQTQELLLFRHHDDEDNRARPLFDQSLDDTNRRLPPIIASFLSEGA